ncbi:TPA: hypothetical protein QCX74_004040 [Bacillus mycoides]|nr:hypothetical protein [Bacillus mycoides]
MKIIGVSCEIWDYPDQYDGSFDAQQLMQDVNQILRKNHFKCIVTHNLDVEYGHSQHQSLSKILHNQKYENLYVFDKSEAIISYRLLRKKSNLLSVYQSQIKGNIENLMHHIVYECIVLSSNKNIHI